MDDIFNDILARQRAISKRVAKFETWEPTDLTYDADAIHDNEANEITAIAEKVVPAANDAFIIEDSAAANVKKKVLFSNIASSPWDNVGARVYKAANFALPNAAWTAIPFDTERWDTDNFHDNAINNTRLTIPEDGIYLIIGNVRITGGTPNVKGVRIILNAATVIGETQGDASGAGTFTGCVSTIYSLSATGPDYVELEAFQNSGVAQTVAAVLNSSPEFMIQRLA